MASDKKLQIPELDFQKIGSIPFAEISDDMSKKIGLQFVEKSKLYGCVRLTNHGLHSQLIDAFQDAATEFFSLPDDVKLKYIRSTVTYDGYNNEEQEHLEGNPDEFKETYNICHLDHSFPHEVPALKTSSVNLFHEFVLLSEKVLKVLEAGLGLKKGTLLSMHDRMIEEFTTLRVLNYPPAPESIPIGTVRCGEHYDTTTLSLLCQYNIGGFQILHGDEWYCADVDRNSILVIYGKATSYFTGNKLNGVKHRVVLSSEDQRTIARKSLVFFVNPNKNVKLTNLLDPSDKNSMTMDDLQKMYFDLYYNK